MKKFILVMSIVGECLAMEPVNGGHQAEINLAKLTQIKDWNSVAPYADRFIAYAQGAAFLDSIINTDIVSSYGYIGKQPIDWLNNGRGYLMRRLISKAEDSSYCVLANSTIQDLSPFFIRLATHAELAMIGDMIKSGNARLEQEEDQAEIKRLLQKSYLSYPSFADDPSIAAWTKKQASIQLRIISNVPILPRVNSSVAIKSFWTIAHLKRRILQVEGIEQQAIHAAWRNPWTLLLTEQESDELPDGALLTRIMSYFKTANFTMRCKALPGHNEQITN